DSGLDRARAAGRWADHLVGDLDSVDPLTLEAATSTTVHRHPTDKDATDAELALQLARTLREGDDDVPLVVIGDPGGRIDHLLADIALLSSPLTNGFHVRAHLGAATITLIRGGQRANVSGSPRDIVSLLAPGQRVAGVTTEGLRWPLVDASLEAGSTRGISNELLAHDAVVTISHGTMLIIQPSEQSSALDDRIAPYDPSPE